MITPDYVRTMAAYNAEMNRRVYAAAARLPDAERRADRGAFWGSIHGTLAGFVAGFDALASAHRASDVAVEARAAEIAAADLEGEIGWDSAAIGRRVVRPRGICAVHLFSHQTHHRGQVHALLTRAGERTGDTDLPFVLPEAPLACR